MLEKAVVYKHQEIGFPESALERELIAKYLASQGYTTSDLKTLPEDAMRALMREACRYAALRLAEIEARSRFCHKIEGPD